MKKTDSQTISIKFKNARQSRSINIQLLKDRIIEFLEYYNDYPLVSDQFRDAISGSTGNSRFSALLEKTGFKDDPDGFLRELTRRLQSASNGEGMPVKIGSIVLPYHFLMAVLEVLIPGRGFKTIRTIEQLEDLTNIKVPSEERSQIEKVLDLYPVRLSYHAIRQMRLSYGVSRQYAPFAGELDKEGEIHTWVGQFFRGIVEQMYKNRVIFIMNMACPVYCRFCFRKHKECRNQSSPTQLHVRQAIAYIKEAPEVKEIVLTGGDPFMNRATLRFAIQELGKIPHVKTLRLATRTISYYPEMFLKEDDSWIRYLIRMNLELIGKGKRIEVATHFVHSDEVSAESLDIISQLVNNGIPVYVQTPFIAGCNNDWHVMCDLFNMLRAAGAEMHYIFLPTSPIQGNRTYWAPLSEGLEVYRHLRMYLSDRGMPHLTTATCIGKLDWNSSGWAVERHKEDPRYIWLRTPYDPDYYMSFAPIMQVSRRTRINEEGTLDASFMSEIGDENLLAGNRVLSSSPEAFENKIARTEETVAYWLESLKTRQKEDQLPICSLDPDSGRALTRSHYSRVEMDIGADDDTIENSVSYINKRNEITDIVLWSKNDPANDFSRTLGIIDSLEAITHISSIRLRSLKLINSPGTFTRLLIDSLAGRNHLRVIKPKRIELEVEILHPSQLLPEHSRIIRELRMRGITVYNNTPVLGYINDNERDMLELSYKCRDLGIEFNNIIITGAPVQSEWNDSNPVDLNVIIDIATYVRRYGSGREVPRYLIKTRLGETDFSIAPNIFSLDSNNNVLATLRPYDLDFYRRINPRFNWPDDVRTDNQGYPVLYLKGIMPGSNPVFR